MKPDGVGIDEGARAPSRIAERRVVGCPAINHSTGLE
jgi:hypothetical protein